MEKAVISYKDSYKGCISSWSKWRDPEWANDVLRGGILELGNIDRDCDARICEVLVRIRILKRHGFWWQSDRLRNHLHHFYQDPRSVLQAPGEPDPPSKGEGGYSS